MGVNAELEGDDRTGADVAYETKVASPLVKKQQALGKGKGGRITPPSVGHLFGFGSTEGYYRAKVLGLRRRGRPGKAFDPETGQGYVPRVRGDYHDAIHVKRATVILLLVEIFGGISPQAVAHIGHLAMRAKGGRDTTRYGHSRTSAGTRPFCRHSCGGRGHSPRQILPGGTSTGRRCDRGARSWG